MAGVRATGGWRVPGEAEAEFSAVRERWSSEFSEDYAGLRPQVVPFTIGLYGHPRLGALAEPQYLLLQLLGLLVLLATCANVGMVVFARTAARTSEMAVRTALGASRRRIVSQLFVESLVVALLAAGGGLLLADRAASRWLGSFIESQPYWIDYGLTVETILWGMGLAAVSAAVVGTVPALKVSRSAIGTPLRGAGPGASLKFGRLSGALIVTNVTLAVITVGAAVFFRSGRAGLEPGAADVPRGVLSAELTIPDQLVPESAPFDLEEYTRQVERIRADIVRRLETEAGVAGVALANVRTGAEQATEFVAIDGAPGSGVAPPQRIRVGRVHPGYFAALGRPVLAGRPFEDRDLESDASTVIVSSTFVERVLGGGRAVGQRLRYTDRRGEPSGSWHRIVGVVDDVNVDGPSDFGSGRTAGGVYHPLTGPKRANLGLAVQVGADPNTFAPRLRALVAQIGAGLIVSDPQSLEDVIAARRLRTTARIRGMALLTAFLVVLAVAGTYALTSFTVTLRRREIGIRAALGGQRAHIAFTVARRSLAQLAGGSLLGGLVAWRILRGGDASSASIPGISELVLSLLLAAGMLVLVGTLACAGPTLRALRIMPAETLQEPS